VCGARICAVGSHSVQLATRGESTGTRNSSRVLRVTEWIARPLVINTPLAIVAARHFVACEDGGGRKLVDERRFHATR